MRTARVIVLGVALAAGGIAAYLASGSRQPEPPPAPPPPPPLATVEVLVATADLGTGQVISDRDIGWQTWPAAAANANFIKKADRPDAIKDFAGAFVRTSIAGGEPLRESKVVMAKGSGYMAAILPRGMRAVSMDVAPDTDAGGFILPNDHVDIVLTHRDKSANSAGGERFVSETILRNVKVLAVDQTVAEKDGEKVVIGKTATVELTPAQAETLAFARQSGVLSLALRSLLDSQSPVPENGERRDDDDHRSINTVRYGVSAQTMSR